MKLLYVPNEDGEFRQLGFRRPLRNLLDAGYLKQVEIFSLQCRIRAGADPEESRRDLIQTVKVAQPDVVLMQHLGSTGLKRRHFESMRSAGDFRLIYHEADPYSRYLHPLPLAAREAGRAADVVFTVGSEVFRSNFLRAGAKDVRHIPSSFEPDRYPFRSVSPATIRFDVVMVANRNQPRWRGLPNWKDRLEFVRKMQAHFGPRFAIFGRGWQGVSAKGAIDFSQQHLAITSGWLTANWDHFAKEAHYFSNRLPISLSCGSVHATTLHDGYSDLFGPETSDFLLLSRDQDDLINAIDEYLSSTSPEERDASRRAAQDFAWRTFRQDDQLLTMLRAVAGDSVPSVMTWDLSAQPLAQV